ncbi:MAG TPA: hypothetical protein VN634_07340 [Candidatus Limnocylindrales bacterium]|nr:hypothetical protein [Candidatus Limnocylindrales bacterium]
MAADTEFPPVRELLPHRGSAVLLARVLGHDAKRTVCAVDPDAGASFRDADGSIPAYVGLEFMAQTIAAHGGLLERDKTRDRKSGTDTDFAKSVSVPDLAQPAPDARPGFFVGTRRISFHVDRFAQGQPLAVTAVHLRSSAGLHAFDCSIDDGAGGAPMVSGVLTVYLLESFEALAEDFSDND